MVKYKIYYPGEGFLLGDFAERRYAEQAAIALDKKRFPTYKSYERAKQAGALYQVKELRNGKEAG